MVAVDQDRCRKHAAICNPFDFRGESCLSEKERSGSGRPGHPEGRIF